MKNCLRIPKVYIPRKDFEAWATLGRDRYHSDPQYLQRMERMLGDSPSALRFLLPEDCFEDVEAFAKECRETMFRLLEEGTLEKLNRGAVLVKRATSAGLRCGILMCLDLETYTMSEGETSPVRPSQYFDRAEAERLCKVRAQAPLEFPHVTVFYRDKRDQIVRFLGEELEEIYSLKLETGDVSGYFIPAFDAEEVAMDMHTRGEPCFAVSSGEEELAGAKLYWQQLKPTLDPFELENHPARFMLVEFINLYAENVVMEPIHRLVEGVEIEVFCSWFAKQVKCKRCGNLLYPAIRGGADAVQKTDELIAQYLRQNGGSVRYVRSEQLDLAAQEDCAAVVLKGIAKEDLFSYLKSGKLLPAHTFVLGGERDGRYHYEGREISYD